MTDYSQIYSDDLSYYREKNLDVLTTMLTKHYKPVEKDDKQEISILGLNILSTMIHALIKAISEKTEKVVCVFDEDKQFIGVFSNEETAREFCKEDLSVIEQYPVKLLEVFSLPSFERLKSQ